MIRLGDVCSADERDNPIPLQEIAVRAFVMVLTLAGVACLAAASAHAQKTILSNSPTAALQGVHLDVQLSARETKIKVGDKPDLTIALKNKGKEALTILRPIDGCDVGWRVVSYEWTVTRDGKPLERKGLPRCGNVIALTKADFITLAPGGLHTFQPAGSFLGEVGMFYPFAEPGNYEVTLTYHFDPKRKESGLKLGKDETGVTALLDRAVVVRKSSPPLKITVVAK
jgi:hypothetical protein